MKKEEEKIKGIKRAIGRLFTKPVKVIKDKKTYTRKKKYRESLNG